MTRLELPVLRRRERAGAAPDGHRSLFPDANSPVVCSPSPLLIIRKDIVRVRPSRDHLERFRRQSEIVASNTECGNKTSFGLSLE